MKPEAHPLHPKETNIANMLLIILNCKNGVQKVTPPCLYFTPRQGTAMKHNRNIAQNVQLLYPIFPHRLPPVQFSAASCTQAFQNHFLVAA